MAEQLALSEMMAEAARMSIQTMPSEIMDLFKQHFNVIERRWITDKDNFLLHLDNLIGSSTLTQEDCYYFFNDENQRGLAIKSLSWIVNVFKNSHSSTNELIYAFELLDVFPHFLEFSFGMDNVFPDSLRDKIRSYTMEKLQPFFTKTKSSSNQKSNISLIKFGAQHDYNWPLIFQEFKLFYQLCRVDTSIKQPFLFMVLYYPNDLYILLDNVNELSYLFSFVYFIPRSRYLDFALNIKNPLIIFLIMLFILPIITDVNCESLIKVWRKIDIKIFAQWIEFFNRIKCYFEGFQNSLVQFLSHSRIEYVNAYFDHLNMDFSPTITLDSWLTFYKEADDLRKSEVLKIAYEKWSNWSCPPKLGQISRSPLDILVIYYFQSPEHQVKCDEIISELTNKILTYQDNWFENEVAQELYLWRLLSQFQLPFIAKILTSDSEPSIPVLLNTFFKPSFFDRDQRWHHRVNLLDEIFLRI